MTDGNGMMYIAIGNGTDVALESAAIALLRGDLGGIVKARRLTAAAMALSSVSVIANAIRLESVSL